MVAPQESSFESSESSSISARKLAANWRNARKSTGPRTAEGKARSSRNAVSHGVYCRDVLIPGEDAHHFFTTRQSFLRALKPQDAVQLALVDAMTQARWRLNRCTRAEAMMLLARQDRSHNQLAAKLRTIEEDYGFSTFSAVARAAQCRADELYRRWHAKWEILTHAQATPLHAGDVLATLLVSDIDCRALERLSRVEQRLHNQFHRCLRDLHVLKQRAKEYADEPECPFLEDWDTNEDASFARGICESGTSRSDVRTVPARGARDCVASRTRRVRLPGNAVVQRAKRTHRGLVARIRGPGRRLRGADR
jgi:hypothetical protein